MSGRLCLLFTAVLLLSLPPALIAEARTAEPGTVPAPAPRVYRITGVVLNSRDGTPVPHCRITATASGQPAPQRDTSQPDRPGRAQGGFPGFGPGSGAGLGGLRGQVEGRVAPPRFGNEAAAGDQPDSVLTDSRGRFVLTVRSAGMWRLTGEARGFRTQAYEEHENFWAGIALTPAVPEINLTFRMTPDAVISGIVFDEAGEPVRNAQVAVAPVRPAVQNQNTRRIAMAANAQTDDRGRYELTGLNPGEYKLKVDARPWYATGTGGIGLMRQPVGGNSASAPSPDPSLDLVYPETWYPAATSETEAEPLTLTAGELLQADFHLTPVPSIHLRVPRPPAPASSDEDQPRGVRAPMVTRENGIGGFFGQTVTSSSSATEWDIGGLSPGTYQVRLPNPAGPGQRIAHVTLGPGSQVVTLDSAEPSIGLPITLDGVEDSQVRQVTFVDTESGQTYTSSGGRRFLRATRNNEDNDDPGTDAAPDSRTVLLPPGQYEVYLNGASGLYLVGLSASGAQVTGRTLQVAGGSPKLTIHAAIGRGEIDGIARKDGSPASGAMVLLVPAGFGKPENLAPVERDETNTDGSFNLRGVIPGPYILVAIDHGWDVDWHDSASLAKYLTTGTPIDLQPGAQIRRQIEAVAP
jgi:hypothetical protein